MSTPPAQPDAGRTPKGTTTPQGFFAPAPPPPPIPDHELLELIGRGSYGQVWLARSRLGTLRAIKIVSREAFEDRKPFEREFKGIQRFEPVSRTHEGLVDILQVGVTDDYFYYVMELADDCQERQKDECKMQKAAVPTKERDQSDSAFSLPPSYFPKTLRVEQQRLGRLPVAECVRIGRVLTSALAHLHRHNLVHRDVKPSNIIFVEGQPKLADIGLVADLSEARSYVGTEGFVPPEGPGTPKADLYSLGKVLYEISTGKDRRDFPAWPDEFASEPNAGKGDTGTSSNSSLRTPPSANEAAFLELNAVIIKACHADLEKRYASAEAMEVDLALLQQGHSVKRRHAATRRLGVVRKYGTATLAICLLVAGGWLLSSRFGVPRTHRVGDPSGPGALSSDVRFVAVLPFENESPAPADEHLGVSIADELSGVLARIAELRVLARGSAAALKSSKDRRASAQQAKVGTILLGQVHKSGNQLKLTVQLLNVADDVLLWSEVYDREMREVFGIQADIAEKVAERLDVKLSDIAKARLGLKPTKDLEAYQLYLEGRYSWNSRTASGVSNAIQCFQQAIQKDPNFAQAYAGLADCYISWAALAAKLGDRGKARENAEKAVLLGTDIAEAHASLGFVLESTDHDFKNSGREFQRALELDPHNATVRSWYGIHLARLGQYEPAVREARLAQELDPLSSLRCWVLCWVLTAARQYDDAIKQFEHNVRLSPSQPQRQRVGDCYFYKGLYEEGIAAFRKAAINNGQDPRQVNQRYDSLLQAYRESGPKGYWARELEMALAGTWREGNDPINLAAMYAWLGDSEQTLACLEKGISSGDIHNVNLTPILDLVRSEPRYKAVLQRLNLPEPERKQ